jgi:hypothetical protein
MASRSDRIDLSCPARKANFPDFSIRTGY